MKLSITGRNLAYFSGGVLSVNSTHMALTRRVFGLPLHAFLSLVSFLYIMIRNGCLRIALLILNESHGLQGFSGWVGSGRKRLETADCLTSSYCSKFTFRLVKN